MLIALMIAGALACLLFIGFLVVGLLQGWKSPTARNLLWGAGVFGVVCALLGMVMPFTGS